MTPTEQLIKEFLDYKANNHESPHFNLYKGDRLVMSYDNILGFLTTKVEHDKVKVTPF